MRKTSMSSRPRRLQPRWSKGGRERFLSEVLATGVVKAFILVLPFSAMPSGRPACTACKGQDSAAFATPLYIASVSSRPRRLQPRWSEGGRERPLAEDLATWAVRGRGQAALLR